MKKSFLAMVVLILTTGVVNAQIVTATATPVAATVNGAAVVQIKVEGTATIQNGQNLAEISIELGTLANGVFTPANPAVKHVIQNPVLVNNTCNYSHQFPGGMPAGTYAARVQMWKMQGGILGPTKVALGAAAHATCTINP